MTTKSVDFKVKSYKSKYCHANFRNITSHSSFDWFFVVVIPVMCWYFTFDRWQLNLNSFFAAQITILLNRLLLAINNTKYQFQILRIFFFELYYDIGPKIVIKRILGKQKNVIHCFLFYQLSGMETTIFFEWNVTKNWKTYII